MSTPQNDLDSDESSGVTTLRPVPVKPARLIDLAESDSTQYFSASELLERGKALAALASEPTAPRAQPAPPQPPATPRRSGWLGQFRQASLARKTAALLLPLLCALLLALPALKKAVRPAISQPIASVPAPVVPAQAKLSAPPPPTALAPALALPRGMTFAHAAADSLATGDFSRAASFYGELARREPENQAYRVIARILSERVQARTQ